MGITVFDRKGRVASLCLAASALLALPAHAASTTGTGSAVVIQPASLVNTGPLDFGNLLAGATPGTVTVTPAGARSTTGGVAPIAGPVSAASFVGMNNSGGFFDVIVITRPATITLNRVGGGATMTVDSLTNSMGNGFLGLGWYFIPANTPYSFTIGGRLQVAANQMPGTYTGTFTINAEYQ